MWVGECVGYVADRKKLDVFVAALILGWDLCEKINLQTYFRKAQINTCYCWRYSSLLLSSPALYK